MKSSDVPNISSFLRKKIKITTTKNKNYVGVLKGYDGFMNVVLENLEENQSKLIIFRGDSIKNLCISE